MSDNIKKLKRSQKGLYLVATEDIADDINIRINNVMSDYCEQIQALQKENKELREIAKQFKETINPIALYLTMDDIESHFREMRWNYLLTINRILTTEGEE